jgi:hypothetical protein
MNYIKSKKSKGPIFLTMKDFHKLILKKIAVEKNNQGATRKSSNRVGNA